MNTPTLPPAAPVPGSIFAVTAATTTSCTAFVGHRRVAQGSYADITAALSGHDLAGDTVLVFDDATSALLDVPSGGVAAVQAPGPQLAGQESTRKTAPPATATAHIASSDAAPADATLAEAKPAVASPQDAARRTATRKDVAPQEAASQDAVPAPPAVGRPKLGVVAREVTLLPRHWEWLATQSGGASAALRRLVEEARRTHAARDLQRAAKDRTFRFLNAVAGNLASFEEAARLLYADDAVAFASHLSTWPADVREHALQLSRGAFGSDDAAQV